MDDVVVLAERSSAEAASELRDVGEEDEALLLEATQPPDAPDVYGWPFRMKERAWTHTAHTVGFIPPPRTSTERVLTIQHSGSAHPDRDLVGKRITVSLDHIRVADYPGRGDHTVLVHFFARNQAGPQTEDLQFTQAFRVREGESAGIVGYPIYVGLFVPESGLAFRCLTVNVRNEDDQAFMDVLGSDVVRSGLEILSTVQPAIGILSKVAEGLTKAIAARHRNVPVQNFFLGLDFGSLATGARLAEGSYVVIQIPEGDRLVWDWEEWVFDRGSGRIVNRVDPAALVPYNAFIFGVQRYDAS